MDILRMSDYLIRLIQNNIGNFVIILILFRGFGFVEFVS
jgi:hypothetical protein